MTTARENLKSIINDPLIHPRWREAAREIDDALEQSPVVRAVDAALKSPPPPPPAGRTEQLPEVGRRYDFATFVDTARFVRRLPPGTVFDSEGEKWTWTGKVCTSPYEDGGVYETTTCNFGDITVLSYPSPAQPAREGVDHKCRQCGAPATHRVTLSAGCVVWPHDREQYLCQQHLVKATPLGTIEAELAPGVKPAPATAEKWARANGNTVACGRTNGPAFSGFRCATDEEARAAADIFNAERGTLTARIAEGVKAQADYRRMMVAKLAVAYANTQRAEDQLAAANARAEKAEKELAHRKLIGSPCPTCGTEQIYTQCCINCGHKAQPTPPAARGEGPEQLARAFHEAYERLAPSFGYETRPESREFKADSTNGRLMIAVCGELIRRSPTLADEEIEAKARTWYRGVGAHMEHGSANDYAAMLIAFAKSLRDGERRGA